MPTMSRTETGKEKVEQLVMRLAQAMTPPAAVSSLVWWSTEALNGESAPDAPRVALRIYRRNSWRSMDFLASDIDGCEAAPELLAKYEGEISQILSEL
jgi:hypothetical protein